MSEQGFVYFIQAGGEFGPLKIGWTSKDPYERVRQLQVGAWQKLTLISYYRGGRELETAYHRILKGSRLEGEWFKACPITLCCAGLLTPESLQECWDRSDAEADALKAAA